MKYKMGCDNKNSAFYYLLQDFTIIWRKNNIEILEVPQKIGRDESTVPQLIGEYFWVTLQNSISIFVIINYNNSNL